MQSRAGSWPVAFIHEIYLEDLDNITRENLLSDRSTPMDASFVLISNSISISLLKLCLLVLWFFRYLITASADSLTWIAFSEFVLVLFVSVPTSSFDRHQMQFAVLAH